MGAWVGAWVARNLFFGEWVDAATIFSFRFFLGGAFKLASNHRALCS